MSPERRGGVFVAVVGPSGAGKDTLMFRAAAHPALNPRIRFVRRIVTRMAVATSEDHESLDEAAFARSETEGAFALVWAAHGLRYGLPRSLEDELALGLTVVANLSRGALDRAASAFGTLHVTEVTARRDILLARLAARGREPEATIRERLCRQAPAAWSRSALGHVSIDNSGDVAAAADLFVSHLNGLCGA